MPSPRAGVRADHDANAARYAAYAADPASHPPLVLPALSAFAELVGRGAHVLDAGCGPGFPDAYLVARRARVLPPTGVSRP